MKQKKRFIRWLGALCWLGGVTAILLVFAFSRTNWGAPGTVQYQTYEFLNRLMAGSLLLMTGGWIGMGYLWPGGYGRWGVLLGILGSFIMVAGTLAEFWLFTDLPYGEGSELRNAAWSAFGVGSLLLDVGAMILGVASWRARLWPRGAAIVFMLALPFDLAAYFSLGSPFLAAAILALVAGYILILHAKIPGEVGTAVP